MIRLRLHFVMIPAVFAISQAGAIASAVTIDADSRPEILHSEADAKDRREHVARNAEQNLIPGERIVLGRIRAFRGEQMEVDIGNPVPLYLPVKPARLKGQTFKIGEPILITMNDHNAVVDYHHPDGQSHHRVVRGRLITPLTVGLDKAVVAGDDGVTQTFLVADRAKGKLEAIPIDVDALFLADETGYLVDAQLDSPEAVEKSAQNKKGKLLGAHEQVRAIYKGTDHEGHITVLEQGRERQVPYRPPLKKLDALHPGQEVVLLMDEEGYLLDMATPALPPD